MSIKITLAFAIVLFSSHAKSYLAKDSANYFKWQLQHFDVIAEKKELYWTKNTALWGEKIFDHYDQSFGFKLQDRPTLVLTSENNQIDNAFATVLPKSLSVYYTGGGPFIEDFAGTNWQSLLLSHEIAHLYQLDAKSTLPKTLKKIFGSHSVIVVPPVPLPITIHPNIFTPTWLLEGNAVFNESRFSHGGRLFSGSVRAVVYSLIKNNLINENRLTNEMYLFPYTREKYLLGAYFNLYLAKTFGTEKTNHFFSKQGEHYLVPFILNSTFRDHYGISYHQIIDQFIEETMPLAKEQQSSASPTLFTSKNHFPINDHGDHLIFLMNETGVEYNQLIKFNKKTLTIKATPTKIKNGLLHYLDQIWAATNDGHYKTRINFGLWDEDRNLKMNTLNKYIMDFDPKNVPLFLDMTQSNDVPQLYHGDRSLGSAHSRAYFDNHDKPYFFRQEGKEKTLIYEDQPLFSYKGYFGKLLNCDIDNNIYFIANTKFGSSLFRYHFSSKKIQRLSSSDTIVNAHPIDPNRSLIVEFHPSGYHYKIESHTPIIVTPTPYNYFFEKKNINLKDGNKNISIPKPASYSHVQELQYDNWSASMSYNNTFTTKLIMNHSDPLAQNKLITAVELENDTLDKKIRLTYLNQYFPVDLFAYLEGMRFESDTHSNPKGSYIDWGFGAVTPVFEYEFWSAKLMWSISTDDINTQNDYEQLATFSLNRSTNFGRSLINYRKFGISYSIENSHSNTKQELNGIFAYDLGSENTLGLEINYRSTNRYFLDWGQDLYENEYFYPTIERFYMTQSRKSLMKASAGYQTVASQGIYFKSFPISLRRWAPKIFGSYLSLPLQNLKYDIEWGVGATFEMLFAHKIPFNIDINYIKSKYQQTDAFVFVFGESFK
ncbi:hypothetical protein OAB57_02580 [Bacteriovoracaceae bacterium]|nr:hypothetical protein [Bacteriovoracaceae bacterium]